MGLGLGLGLGIIIVSRLSLTEGEGRSDDDDDALGGVGDALRGGGGLLDGERGELVVQVEVESRGDEVGGDHRVGLEEVDELAELGTLLLRVRVRGRGRGRVRGRD